MANPIEQRLRKLTLYWLEFTDNPKSRICRWLVKTDELNMIKTFYQLQISEGNDTADFFIQLSSPFENITDFSSNLKIEFLEIIKSIQEETDETDIKEWTPGDFLISDHSDITFLTIINRFAECLNLPEGFLVIFLTPRVIKHLQSFMDWLAQTIEKKIPDKARFMLIDTVEENAFNDLCEKYPDTFYTIIPDLNMNAAVKELASAGDPSEPGVQFRKAFVLLTQAIAKQDMSLVKKTSAKAFAIADEYNWPHMKVAVKMATAGAYQGKKDYQKAYEIYGEAFHFSDEAYKNGDSASGKLAITTLFSQASSMIGAKKYDLALESYQKAVPYAEENNDYYNQSEAWRMSAYCHKQLKRYDEAWSDNWKALDSGEKMDEQMRKNGTLPFVGQELMLLAKKINEKDQLHVIDKKMIQLAGKNWTEKLYAK